MKDHIQAPKVSHQEHNSRPPKALSSWAEILEKRKANTQKNTVKNQVLAGPSPCSRLHTSSKEEEEEAPPSSSNSRKKKTYQAQEEAQKSPKRMRKVGERLPRAQARKLTS